MTSSLHANARPWSRATGHEINLWLHVGKWQGDSATIASRHVYSPRYHAMNVRYTVTVSQQNNSLWLVGWSFGHEIFLPTLGHFHFCLWVPQYYGLLCILQFIGNNTLTSCPALAVSYIFKIIRMAWCTTVVTPLAQDCISCEFTAVLC